MSERLYLMLDDQVGKEATMEWRPGGMGSPVLLTSPLLAMDVCADMGGAIQSCSPVVVS